MRCLRLKRNAVDANIAFGLVISLTCIILLIDYAIHFKGGKALLGLTIILLVSLPFYFKRFLSELTVDFDRETIETVSVIAIVKRAYTLDQLTKILIDPVNRTILAAPAFKTQNLILHFQGRTRPLIYQIKNREEFAVAEQIIQLLGNLNQV